MSNPRRTRKLHPHAAALLAAALAGCAAPRVAPPSQPTVTQTPARDSVEGPLKAARAYAWTAQMDETARRLRSGLGSGADLAQTTDQRLWVSMPTAEAFDPGRSAIRPGATSRLDQIAVALRSHARAEVQIVASADAGSRGAAAEALALDRAASARDWLAARGVAPPRMSVAGVAARAAASGGERRLDILIGERADGAAR